MYASCAGRVWSTRASCKHCWGTVRFCPAGNGLQWAKSSTGLCVVESCTRSLDARTSIWVAARTRLLWHSDARSPPRENDTGCMRERRRMQWRARAQSSVARSGTFKAHSETEISPRGVTRCARECMASATHSARVNDGATDRQGGYSNSCRALHTRRGACSSR